MLPHGPKVRGDIYFFTQHTTFIYATNIVKKEEMSIPFTEKQDMIVLSGVLEPIPYTKEQNSIIVLR